MSDDRYLHIYLNDHAAGQAAGRQLTRRALANNRGTPLGDYLERFLAEIEEEAGILDDAMRRVGAQVDPLKQAAAWLAERIGRLKLNGQLLGYSDLSRLEEVEGLCLGVDGRLSLWRALGELADSDARLAPVDFDALTRRARTQRRRLERFRVEAATQAFGA